MPKFKLTVSGALLANVEAKTEAAAETKLRDWLEDNSPVRNWEVDAWGINKDDNDFDIVI